MRVPFSWPPPESYVPPRTPFFGTLVLAYKIVQILKRLLPLPTAVTYHRHIHL